MKLLTELAEGRELMANLTLRELRSKYKRSALGWIWSLLNPLASMLIFTVVFLFVLKVPTPEGRPSGFRNFPFFLLSGLLLWNFLSNSITSGLGTLIGNAGLIKKVYFRREILVMAAVASWLVSLLIEVSVLAAAFMVAGNFVLPWLPGMVVIIALLALFTLGISLALGAVNVYFRDVEHLMGVVLQLWFYATPILYPVSLVPESREVLGVSVPLRDLYDLNPMVKFVGAARNCLYDLRFPPLSTLAYLLVASMIALGVGLVVFSRLEPKLAEEL